MNGTTFDALAAAGTLREAGFEDRQAEAVAGVVRHAVDADRGALATKADIAALRADTRADIAALRADTRADLAALRAGPRQARNAPHRAFFRHGRRACRRHGGAQAFRIAGGGAPNFLLDLRAALLFMRGLSAAVELLRDAP